MRAGTKNPSDGLGYLGFDTHLFAALRVAARQHGAGSKIYGGSE